MPDTEVDVAIVGAGGAGLTLLHELALRGPARLRVALIDPVDRLTTRPADRTWCFWDSGTSDVDAAVHRSWHRMLVVGPDHRRRVVALGPLRYAMVRSQDFYALVAEAARRLDVVHLATAAERVEDGAEAAEVHTPAGSVRARWVFDSRPAPPLRPARTELLQHFRGLQVRTETDVFDPELPLLMDFTTPQPTAGLSFGYCLPSDPRSALVEYTEFSPAVLDDAGYAIALEAYLPHLLGGDVPHVVEHVEQGVIPMTDAVHARRAGRRLLRLGTAGGATRPATGYTFAAMMRQASAVAAALAAGADPEPPPPYRRRHRWMDALMLRALADGSLDGPRFFTQLFDGNPAPRLVRFLDGRSGLLDDLRVISTAPKRPMLRAAARDTADRVRLVGA
jgi:lycopene beta-cyclase